MSSSQWLPVIINLENLHPDFCLTHSEVMWFLLKKISFSNIHSKLCQTPYIPKGLDTFCNSSRLEDSQNHCTIINGSLIIENGDEQYVSKLSNLEYLFGSLTIQNTTLKNLDFLRRLKYIALFEDEYVIQIVSNMDLEKANIPRLSVS